MIDFKTIKKPAMLSQMGWSIYLFDDFTASNDIVVKCRKGLYLKFSKNQALLKQLIAFRKKNLFFVSNKPILSIFNFAGDTLQQYRLANETSL